MNEKKYTDNQSQYISFFICFIIGLGLIYLESIVNINNEYTPNTYNSLFLILSGFLFLIFLLTYIIDFDP